ncbi:cytochrome P450 [Aspergillus leporis]|uniref:Cytochrome P450 n=1 Tax=Aspergillus leporis TaxID=41062 RepID=A0A5N5XEP2_9EURO|nr:cytochrome P450 [Aspergillus leporis]
MFTLTEYFIAACVWLVLYKVGNLLWNRHHYSKQQKARGCGEIKHYRHRDPILGLDFVYTVSKAFKEHRWLPWQQELFAAQGVKTFQANFLGSRAIYTCESENMKAMSTTYWREFGLEPLRRGSGAADPVAGPGVSTVDGPMWDFSRNIIKPYFTRDGYSNLARLEVFVNRLLHLVPTDGSTFDMQPLLQRWFLDTSSEFLFGKTVDSLTHPENAKVAKAMVDTMRGIRVRLTMSKLMFLHRDPVWMENVQIVRDFVDERIDASLTQLQDVKSGKGTSATENQPDGRTDLLWDMVQQLQDKEALRGQIMAVFIPSNDTTSILISNAIFALARHPHVYQTLREEVLALGDEEITFEKLRGLRYLRYVINETHRLYPNGIQMVRIALEDTTLPVGGGPNQSQPIFIQKGDIVHANRYLMHRDPDNWGPDAEVFRPERWGDARPLWKFVPFGGGPRICPAHVLVDTEASYVLLRFVQRFRTLEPRDDRPYKAIMRIGPSNLNGVNVAVKTA